MQSVDNAQPKWIVYSFYAAAAYNIVGMMTLTQFLTLDRLGAYDPIFDLAGAQLVILWGAAYLATSRHFHVAPHVVLVFAFEKAWYFKRWLEWLSERSGELSDIAAADPGAGFFYATYGAGDGLFMAFFAYVWWTYRGAGTDFEAN